MIRPFDEWAKRRSLTRAQAAAAIAMVVAAAVGLGSAPITTGAVLIGTLQSIFVAVATWRIVMMVALPVDAGPLADIAALPRYTILVALLDEAAIVDQIVSRLAAIDYPPDRLEAFLLLEAHDRETIDAAWHADRPDWLSIVLVPPGEPRTKPRALNVGLARATGDLITVYDAEDDPHPLQLREAAARFAADRASTLATLQAPLRIRLSDRTRTPFLDRQFALEYAGLFEVTLPAMARLGLPFPLGGTSNHFRTERLRTVGGWDAHNVTEDADLGFRLWRAGGTLGVLTCPTHEPPPGGLEAWLPQRTRWLKGYMQTCGVHTRALRCLGWRGLIALMMTVAAPVIAAALHAVSLAWLAALVLIAGAAGLAPRAPVAALGVLGLGIAAAWVNAWVGARRAGLDYRLTDALQSPLYWSMLTLAFGHALVRLIHEPFTWNKTRHAPDAVDLAARPRLVVPMAGRRAA
ncbi:glycosyltransferase family 2 protein [Brevundimonas sp. LM2]|uniref:glycosyltransferase family 2 protein n=1 Tax=Brevundimonas sp. LM2 TaxID=1938605 RepID=UPI00209B2BC3|nr:glycosyltransferase family 2 protein [Brevundimonas sp. LM2]